MNAPRPSASLLPAIVTAVGLSLAGMGALGAVLSAWQLAAWFATGGPTVAAVWEHSGLTGRMFVAFFRWLPAWLALGVAFHALVAWLGAGLLRRRRAARRGAIAFAFGWAALALAGWAAFWVALDDLERGFPDRAAFAAGVKPLVAQVSLFNVGVAAALVLLLIQPVVRREFGE